jgi:hypothetical protein
MATPRWISGTNAFIPEATGVAIAYVRDPARFKLNQYVELVRAPKPVALYAFLDPDAPTRVVSSEEFDWPDGQPRPKPQATLGNFKWEEVRMFRKDFGYTIGEQAVETAEGWNPKAFFNAIILSLAMTEATFRVTTLLETTSAWGANTASANTLNGGAGTWDGASDDEASVKFLAIKKSLNAAVRKVLLATNGAVQRSDLRLQISPDLADIISETAELHHYLSQSPHALAQVKGDAPNVNAPWSIPETLYGLPVVVEDASRVKVRPAADGTAATLETEKVFIRDKKKALILSRIGGLDGNYGSPSFSTVQRHYYKYEMAIESKHDTDNKLYESHVVDQFKEVLVAPQSGFLITACAA